MRSDLESSKFHSTDWRSGTWSLAKKAISAEYQISDGSPVIHKLTPATTQNVRMPAVGEGKIFLVCNEGTSGNNLLVIAANGSAIVTLRAGDSAFVFADDAGWKSFAGGGFLDVFTTTVDGLVPHPGVGSPGQLFLRNDGQWAQVQVVGIVDAFKFITDGTTIAIGSGPDTFRLRSSTNKIGVTVQNNDATFGDNANFTVLEAAVDHNALLNFVADKHVAHTSVTLTAGLALTGGGDISASRTFDFAPAELTINAAPVLTDYAVMDLAAGGPRRTLFSAINAILNHNLLLNYVANQHIDHTTVSISAGTGLTGGGTIAASRTLSLDINGLTADTLAAADFFAFFDTSGGDTNKISFANLNASIDHNALANYVANQHIDHTTVSISTTEGIQGGGTIAATRTLKLDINGLTADASPDAVNDYVTTWDASASLHKKVLIQNLPASGFNITTLPAATIVGADEIPFYQISASLPKKTTLTNFKTALALGTASAHAEDDFVRFDASQSKSAAQMTQAQANMNFNKVLAGAVDLNTVVDPGTYSTANNTCTNGPYTGGQWYIDVVVYSGDPTNYIMQRATSMLGPSAGPTLDEASWTRVKLAGTWQPWRRAGLIPLGHLWGYNMSTAGSSTTLTVGVGQCTDSSGCDTMTSTTGAAKTTSAWAVGTAVGGLDTGSIAANTWYHWYVIKRPDTGVVDVLFSLSATTPTLPTNYTLKRRIGSMKTNGSSQWTSFIQYEDSFYLQAPASDSATQPGLTDTLFTLSVPTGIRVKPMIHISSGLSVSSSEGIRPRVPDLQTTETGVDSSGGTAVGITTNVARSGFAWNMDLWTNTSAQINIIASVALTIWAIRTYGWIDTRGKLS